MSEPQKVSATDVQKPGRGWVWLVLLVIAGVGAFLYVRTRPSKESPQGEKGGNAAAAAKGGAGGGKGGGFGGPIMLGAAPAKKGDMGVYVNALGSVTPLNTVAVRSRVEGQLVKVHYTEGSFVKEGDALAEIDPAPYQASLAQAEGQLARDTASLENAKLDLQRYKDAFARNAVPKQQLDTQTSSVRQFEGAVKFDQGQVETARVQLNYCHIVAPISGRVGLRMIDAGNIVRANDTNPLVVITQLKPISVVFSVAEDHLPKIQKQVRAGNKLKVDALDRAQISLLATGELQTVDNQIDPGTGTVKLKAVFGNEDETLFPSQFVNARLLVEMHRGVALVPTRAVQRGAQGAFVFTVKPDQTVAAQTIQTGPTENDLTEAGGLEPGTLVALDNFNRLTDGAKVMLRPGGPPGGGGGKPGGGGGGRTNGPSGGSGTNRPGSKGGEGFRKAEG